LPCAGDFGMREIPLGLEFRSAVPLGFLQRLVAAVIALSGWRRHLASAVLGMLAAAALPPVDLVPLLVPAFSGLLWLSYGCRGSGQAFRLGWSFGFGFFLLGLYWISAALFTDIASFWWLVPFAFFGFPAAFGVFSGISLLLLHWFGGRGTARVLGLAVAWTAGEWLRGHVLTGFPWNLVGYAWAGGFPGSIAMLQMASVTGIYGLSFLTVIAAALPGLLGRPLTIGRGGFRRLAPVLAAVLLIAVPAVFGALRLEESSDPAVPGVRLRLVQPSIPQTTKWDPVEQEANFRRLLALSAEPAAKPVTDIIWPEAAATFYLNRDPVHRAEIAAVAPPHGLVITGTLRTDPAPDKPEHFWNSLLAIDRAGEIVGSYDKFHLVPFGEYVPLRGLLPIPAVAANVDFSTGPGPQTLTVPGLPPFSPLICYEIIFPDEVTDPARRPDWLLTVTNDAWFGMSFGPFQHFAMARVRAVEEGLPMIRDANNGISGVVDSVGRVVGRTDLDAIGVLDVDLPTTGSPTLYAESGDWVLFGILLLCTPVAIRWRR
jgi:apolipoprotein N-acyltransferase